MLRRSSSFNAPSAVSGSTVRSACMRSVALARDHVGLVEEPEALVATQHLLRRLEVSAVSHDLAQAVIFDLCHVNSGVPRREKGPGADWVADLRRGRVDRVCGSLSLFRS